ncbi:MAG: ribonuclease HI family protein [Candidatus Beckwithbacteria bacterium]
MNDAVLNIYTDGGSRGNPGPAAIGVVVKNSLGKTLAAFGKTIGSTTNNQAEYQALIAALNWLKNHPAVQQVNFFLDSVLVVNQLNGLWKIKNVNLRRQLITIRELEAAIPAKLFYQAIPREQNLLADLQVNLALDKLL